MENKVYNFIKGNLINFVVILTSVGYMFYNMVVIKRTDLTIAECLLKAGLGLVVGFMIKQSLSENGFNKGYESDIWNTNLEKYSKNCNAAVNYIDLVDNFYACEEIEKKKNYRRSMLMGNAMKYEWFFDIKGNYIVNDEKLKTLTKQQKKVLNKCIKVKIYTLNLFNEYSNEIEADTKREKTDKDQRFKMARKNTFAQLISAIMGAYFVASWNNWDWGAFITAFIQVCIWVSCGITQLYTNYNYIVIDKVGKLKKKSELIVKFTKGCENGLYKTNPYEEVNNEKVEIDNISNSNISTRDLPNN